MFGDDLPSRFSIRIRLTFLASAGSAVVLAVGATLMFASLTSAIDRAVTAEIRVRADDLAAELRLGGPVSLGGSLRTQILRLDGTVVSPADEPALLDGTDLAAAAGAEIVVDRTVDDDTARIVAKAADRQGERVIVAVAGTTTPIDEARQRLVLVLAVAGPLLVAAVGATAWSLTGAALRPVGRMTGRAATLSFDGSGTRLPQPPGRDEVAQLGHTLNEMLDRIETMLARERAFVDNASHELRTPLAVLRGELELLRADLIPTAGADAVGGVDSALEEVDRLTRLANHLLVLARSDAGQRDGDGASPIAEVVDDVLARIPPPDDVAVVVERAEARVPIGNDALSRMVTNLVTNAFDHATTRVEVRVDAGPELVWLRVRDDGPGFDPSILDSAFDRFVRADAARTRGGTGLGLAIVEAIATGAGGECRAENHPDGGAIVTVTMPRHLGDRRP